MVNGHHIDIFVGRGQAALSAARLFGRQHLSVRVLSRPGIPATLPPWDRAHAE
jgi:hypothetical protein